MQSATSMHEPGIPFAVHDGAALAAAASGVVGIEHVVASISAASPIAASGDAAWFPHAATTTRDQRTHRAYQPR